MKRAEPETCLWQPSGVQLKPRISFSECQRSWGKDSRGVAGGSSKWFLGTAMFVHFLEICDWLSFFHYNTQLQTQFCVCTIVFFRCRRPPQDSDLPESGISPALHGLPWTPPPSPLSWPWCCPGPRPAFTVIPSLSLECSSPALCTLTLCLLVLAEVTPSEAF